MHFDLGNIPTNQGSRPLLMEILMPLLGEGVAYSNFMGTVNNYLQASRYNKARVSEDAKRFLDHVSKDWKTKRA